MAPTSWRGALPITYHVGPGPATVRVHLEFDWGLETAYNVIATLPGSEFPDEWVIRGNHRDGWAMGAADPISGTVSMMEEARVIGELAQAGMRPRRTIMYGSWDAEEPGTARLDGVGRTPRRRTAAEGRGLHQHGWERPRIPEHGRVAHPAELHQRRGALGHRPADRCLRVGAAARHAVGGRFTPGGRWLGHHDQPARLGLGLHALPPAPRHRVAQPELQRRERRGLVPLAVRLVRPLLALRRSRLPVRCGAREDDGARHAAARECGRHPRCGFLPSWPT